MVAGVFISKVLAIAVAVLTVSAVGGIVTMAIIYVEQIKNNPPVRPPTPVPTTPLPTGPPPTLRLPPNLVPESYDVNLHSYLYPELTNTTEQVYNFTGNSTVRFKCVEDTKSIFLHSLDLSFNKVVVTQLNTSKALKVRRWEVHQNESNFFEIQLQDVLTEGNYYELFTEFTGEILDDLAGLYVSSYEETVDGEQVKKFLIASQMQPTDARKVFPCFDEPAMKAVFNITFTHRCNTYTKILSNTGQATHITSTDEEGYDWCTTKFNPTPVMSTYLLALTVNEFKCKGPPNTKIPHQVCARREAVEAHHVDYANSITEEILQFYEQEFGIDYPLSKLDQIAVPDFGAGAMENWGLIMYRESALLYEEGVSSTANKEWVATVIAHELAHQWLGNLVTMKWWNNLWLNEGFATYMSYLGVNRVEPDWNIEDLMLLKEVQPALELDSLNSTHALSSREHDVQTPSQIAGLFNTITYSKGAAVLRMLAEHIKKESFMAGIRCYLKAHESKTAEPADLWQCYKGVNVWDVESVMKTWVEQVGYPVININTNTGEYIQEQFLLKRGGNSELKWLIPIRHKKAFTTEKSQLLTDKGPVNLLDFKVGERDGWLLANINCTGFFRVNYDEANWNRLITQLELHHSVIPLLSRGQLIDDAFNLARAKYIDVTLALNTTKYLINETEYVPWESALNNLQYYILMFDRSEVYGPMQKYLRKQVTPLYEYFQEYTENGTVPDNHAEQYNQINAISVACSNDHPECIQMAKDLFKEWRNGTNRIPPNLKSTIYCNAIAAGDEDDWEFGWKQYEAATIATEKDKLRYALSCTKKIWLLSKYLEYTLNPEKIRKMDAVSTINYIARNVAGHGLAWDFIRAHWTYMTEENGAGAMSVGSLIDEVTQRFSTEFELQQLRQFQSEHDKDGLGPATRSLEQAIERTEANIKWVKENKQTVLTWFRSEIEVQ